MKLLTVRETCDRLRISRATLYKLVKQGSLTLVKVGGKSLVREEALEKLLTAGAGTHGAAGKAWEEYFKQLLRGGLTTPGSREAIVTPAFEDFAPIAAPGKPASELIIQERDAL